MASGTAIGEVSLNPAKVAAREEDGQFLLLHVPSGRFVALDEDGRRVWERIAKGTRDIATLIREHGKEAGLEPEVAAFQVVSFLDELRAQDFLDFRLTRETEAAPHLDAPLAEATTGPATAAGKRVIMLEASRPGLSLRDLKQLAERAVDADMPPIERVILAEVPADQLSVASMKEFAEKADGDSPGGIRRLVTYEAPAPEWTVGELHKNAGVKPRLTTARAARTIIVIIVIVDGVIIVVVADGGTGGSYGKSRSACKTVCVSRTGRGPP